MRSRDFVVIEEGALCNLEEFDIGPCPQLKELPSGFQHLRKLQEISFYQISINFLKFENVQYLQNTGADIWFSHKIFGLIKWWIKLEQVMEILKFMQGKS